MYPDLPGPRVYNLYDLWHATDFRTAILNFLSRSLYHRIVDNQPKVKRISFTIIGSRDAASPELNR